MEDEISIYPNDSTNRVYDVDELLIRKSPLTNLVLTPQLVRNSENRDQPLKISLRFQKIPKNASWEDYSKKEDFTQKILRAGEYLNISLSASETDYLRRVMNSLHGYSLESGLYEYRKTDLNLDGYTVVNSEKAALIQDTDISKILSQIQKKGEQTDAILQMLEWLSKSEHPQAIVEKLRTLEADKIANINAILGLSTMKACLQEWYENRENGDEEFWQQSFQKYPFVISSLFSGTVVFEEGKALVGGKAHTNKGGSIVDLLFKHALTENVVLIELKTPCTKLIANKEYRNKVFASSKELSGAINQLLNYRQTLTEQYKSLMEDSDLTSWSPKGILIIGHFGRELSEDKIKKRSFELFRSSLKDIDIVTFDEIYKKLESQIKLLEEGV